MAVTFPKQRLYHCMNQKATKIPHCPKRAVRLLKMTFRVLLALPLNFSSSCPPPVLFILSTLSCQVCLQFSDFAPDFQSFSSVFCFLLCCFIKITIRYTCLEFKMAWSLSSEVYFLYFTSTHVAYAAPELIQGKSYLGSEVIVQWLIQYMIHICLLVICSESGTVCWGCNEVRNKLVNQRVV